MAAVSTATVSRVLNAPDKVRPDTRSKVEGVIAELGFVPSAAARAVNSGRSRILGALIPALDSAIFAKTLNAIESRLDDFGLSLVVATFGDDPETEARKAKALLDIGVEGLFLTGVNHSPKLEALIERARSPSVVISYYDPAYSMPTIGYDNRAASRMALDHLTALGHEAIAVIHAPAKDNDRIRARLAGLTQASQRTALTFFEAPFSVAGGTEAVASAMAEDAGCTAYLCLSDILAMGVLFELQRRGVSVPEAVSVMGIDDLASSMATYPRLSTVRLPAEEMGLKAAEALATWVETDVRPPPLNLSPVLCARESVIKNGVRERSIAMPGDDGENRGAGEI